MLIPYDVAFCADSSQALQINNYFVLVTTKLVYNFVKVSDFSLQFSWMLSELCEKANRSHICPDTVDLYFNHLVSVTAG